MPEMWNKKVTYKMQTTATNLTQGSPFMKNGPSISALHELSFHLLRRETRFDTTLGWWWWVWCDVTIDFPEALAVRWCQQKRRAKSFWRTLFHLYNSMYTMVYHSFSNIFGCHLLHKFISCITIEWYQIFDNKMFADQSEQMFQRLTRELLLLRRTRCNGFSKWF